MIRPKQLSSDMNSYMLEMKDKADKYRVKYYKDVMLGKITSPYYALLNAMNKICYKLTSFMNVDYTHLARPIEEVPHQMFPLQLKVDLFDGSYPERLLFSSPDTRFGMHDLSYLFYHANSHMASINSADIDFNVLYKETYSKYFGQKIPTSISPHYRRYCGWGVIGKVFMYCLKRRYFFLPVSFRDKTTYEVIANVRPYFSKRNKDVMFLDVGCFKGRLLTALREKTSWNLYGIDINRDAVDVVQTNGFQSWCCDVNNIINEMPDDMKFDVIHLGQSIEHFPDPLQVINVLHGFLNDGGIVVISSPNLDSGQVKLFGPTWSHWHPPFHQWIFSKKSIQLFAKSTGLTLKRFTTRV